MRCPPTLILRTTRRLATVLLLLTPRLTAPPARAGHQEVRKAGEARKNPVSLERPLDTLADGDAAERRKVADNACRTFEALESSSNDETQLRGIVEELRRIIRREEDDWISARLVQELGCMNSPILNPIFLDALGSPSRNLRWRAFRWFAKVEDSRAIPLLEEAWPDENRPWARKDLIAALARNRSSRYLEEFRSLAEEGDPETASAAIGAILLLNDAISLPLLARLAREGEDWQRWQAADALSIGPESTIALAALLEATQDENPLTRECAVRSLAKRDDKASIARALAVTVADPEEEVRKAGVQCLEASSMRAFIHKTLRATSWPPDEYRDGIEARLLRNMSDFPSGAIRAPAPLQDPPGRHDREPRCVYRGRGGLDSSDPDSPRVSPPAGRSSARCFEVPGIPGDPRSFQRVPRGSLLMVYDHFEGRDENWVRVGGPETSRECWMPASQVVPQPWEGPADEEAGILRRDFDLPAEEVGNPAFAAMMQAGMVEIIELADGMPAVTLRVRMGSPRDEALLRYAASYPGSLLLLNAFWMMESAQSRLCGYPSMVALATDLGLPVESCVETPGNPDDEEGANSIEDF